MVCKRNICCLFMYLYEMGSVLAIRWEMINARRFGNILW